MRVQDIQRQNENESARENEGGWERGGERRRRIETDKQTEKVNEREMERQNSYSTYTNLNLKKNTHTQGRIQQKEHAFLTPLVQDLLSTNTFA